VHWYWKGLQESRWSLVVALESLAEVAGGDKRFDVVSHLGPVKFMRDDVVGLVKSKMSCGWGVMEFLHDLESESSVIWDYYSVMVLVDESILEGEASGHSFHRVCGITIRILTVLQELQ